MYRLFLAFRYIWNRPFSWIAVCGIWLTVTALICTVAIMNGYLEETKKVYRGTTSDLIVSPMSNWASDGQSEPPPSFEQIEATLAGIPGIEAMSPHFVRPALLSVEGAPIEIGKMTPDDPSVLEVIGVDLEREARTTGLLDFHAAGSVRYQDAQYLEALRDNGFEKLFREGYESGGQRRPIALVGEGLIERFGIRAGQLITLVTLPEDVSMESAATQAMQFLVVGSFRTGHYKDDRTSIYVSLEHARAFARSRTSATEICVRTNAGTDLTALAGIAREAEQRLRGARLRAQVETWNERHGFLLSSVENQRSILAFILFFFVAVACFNVFASLTILVSDKIRDIGVLNAMGASRSGISGIFILCATLLTLFGALLGAGSGVLVSRNLDAVNEGVGVLLGEKIFTPDIYHFDQIPVQIQPWFVVFVVFATLVLAILFALLPSVRAARMDAVQALRFE